MIYLTCGGTKSSTAGLNADAFSKLTYFIIILNSFQIFIVTGLVNFFVKRELKPHLFLGFFGVTIFLNFFLEKKINSIVRYARKDIVLNNRYILNFDVPIVLSYIIINIVLIGYLLYLFVDMPINQAGK